MSKKATPKKKAATKFPLYAVRAMQRLREREPADAQDIRMSERMGIYGSILILTEGGRDATIKTLKELWIFQ